MTRRQSAEYRSLEGTLFTLEPREGQWSISLRLDRVSDLGAVTGHADRPPCYSLCFSQQSPAGGCAPQGIYRLRHDVLGEQELFVVPLGPSNAAQMQYEVIFN
jgi:hypothetical protein